MKSIKLALSLIFIIMLVTSMCPINAATIERNITIKDPNCDVLKTDEENPVCYYDVDITNITCVQTGRRVDIEFKLAEGGIFKKTLDTIYSAELYTTSDLDFGYYLIMYGAAISEYFQDVESDVVVFSLESIANNKSLNVISESIEKNVLSVSFNLENSYERILDIALVIEKTVGNISYSDQAPDEDVYENIGSLEITSGGEYFLDAGQTVQLQGNLVEGNPSDYESYSYVILEAWGLAKPTIITPFSGIAQAHGKNMKNTWILKKDFSDLERALQFFIDNPKIARKIGQQARLTVMKNRLTCDGYLKDLEILYQNVG